MSVEPSVENKNAYLDLKTELEELNEIKINGALLRARADLIEMNEKNTNYFLKLEEKNCELWHIRCIKKNSGDLITNHKDILHEQKTFYENLYSDKDLYETDATDFFLDNVLMENKLSGEDRNYCDEAITYEEIAKAIKDLPNNKSPGTDGFPIEFYKFFWKEIKDLVVNSILYCIRKEKLSIDQRQGVLATIPKKGKNIRLLKNWRPLTLLNTHYKILAKLLAKRLQRVL